MKVTQAQFDEMARVGTVSDLEIVDAVPAPEAVAEAAPVVEAAPAVETAAPTM
jgi:hypothetical protein